eukprot:m.400536 g.400536  ORF g.400536 m.400536 type:complete len:309 (-) comp56439_c0_seq38:170-1096(-)
MRESQPGQMRSGAIVNRHGKIGGHLHQISLDVCCRHLLQGEAQSQQTFRGEVFCSSNNNSITINNNTRTTTATTTITTTSTKVHADSLGQSGEESKRNVELPAQKQFLMARRVPCTAAASAATLFTEKLAEDGWVETESTQKAGSTVEAKAAAEEEDDEEVVDIDDFDYSQAAAEDDSAVAPADATTVTRSYDVTVTYDRFYQTPRVFLVGYDEKGNPLKGDDWKRDFSPEHVDKTVSVERHYHFSTSCPTIHPCKHADAMLRMVQLVMGSREGNLDVKFYLLIFLKFIQSMIPNIEYDYTSEFNIEQ